MKPFFLVDRALYVVVSAYSAPLQFLGEFFQFATTIS